MNIIPVHHEEFKLSHSSKSAVCYSVYCVEPETGTITVRNKFSDLRSSSMNILSKTL